MSDEVDELCKILLDPKPDTEGLRSEAASKLSNFLLDIRGFNALYSICVYPDKYALEDHLLPVAGESIGKIISTRDLADKDSIDYHEMKPTYFDNFHPQALDAALAPLTDDQQKRVYAYILENLLSSAVLTIHFYRYAIRSAVSLYLKGDVRCRMEAANAIKLTKRFPDRTRNLELYFNGIVMRMISGEAMTTIFPLFQGMYENYPKFLPPQTDFEKYQRLHILMITKLACSDQSRIQEFVNAIKEMVSVKYPGDEPYFEVLKLMVQGQHKPAQEALENVKQQILNREDEEEDQEHLDFSTLLLVPATWLIKQWLFYRRA